MLCLFQDAELGPEQGSGMLNSLPASAHGRSSGTLDSSSDAHGGPLQPPAAEPLAAGRSGAADGASGDLNGRSGSLPVKRSASAKAGNGEAKEEYAVRVQPRNKPHCLPAT